MYCRTSFQAPKRCVLQAEKGEHALAGIWTGISLIFIQYIDSVHLNARYKKQAPIAIIPIPTTLSNSSPLTFA